MADLRRSAEWYAAHVLHVFAARERDKRPATQRGVLDATTSLRVIDRMWTATPRANVAIACGPSGLVVIDVDGPEGAASLDTLERAHGALPITCEAVTARGRHIYFAHDQGALRIGNSASKLGAGLDVRGDGGYVLAPPSVHPSGYVYRWAPGRGPHEIQLAPLPEWVVELLTDQPIVRTQPIAIAASRTTAYAQSALARECADVAQAAPGARNHRLNAAAFSLGQLVAIGALDAALARGALIGAGIAAGLKQREAIKTANSGLSAGMRHPRQLQERSAAHG